MKLKVYVISLSSSHSRRKILKQQFNDLELKFELIDAVTPRDIPQEQIDTLSKQWLRPMKNTELACYLSHKKIWEIISNDNLPSLIFEDDVLLSKKIVSLLESISLMRQNYDLINLENRGRRKFVSRNSITIDGYHELFRLYQDRTGAAAYILSKNGAIKLLDHERRNGVALADAHITSCNNLKSFQVEPAVAVQFDHCDFYKINLKNFDCNSISQSTVSSAKNMKGGVTYRFKRLKFQLLLGLKQIMLIPISKRRYIKLIPNDFL